MTEHALSDPALFRLLTWTSPSYPVGAYTYSHGLEAAVEAGLVTDAASALAWIADLVADGGGFADAVLVFAAHAAAREGDLGRLAAAAELACAFAPSTELLTETTAQGRAFAETTLAIGRRGASPLLSALAARSSPIPLPVALGCAAAEAAIPAPATALAHMHAFAANLVSACLRLAPVGQTGGQRILAALEPTIVEAVRRAERTPLDALALSTLAADICSMQHETQRTRLFRS